MKSRFGKVHFGYVIFIFAFLFGIGILGCTNDGNPINKTKPRDSSIISDSFFWGTWVRMDNGEEYEILESNVIRNYTSFTITDSSIDSLSVSGLGTFKKESDSVIVCDNIPYFRKGGANLEYSLKIVGFTSSETISSNKSLVSRAAGTNVSGIKGKGKSKKYKNFESDSESDEDGTIIFTAPTANDPQTVELITDDDEIVIITGLEVSNDGDNMGTVALVGKDDYNLKITGKISDDQKDGGYLFGNNAKTYEMEIKITNVSENKCKSSICTISPASPNLSIASSDTNLEGFTISTLASGATKIVKVSVVYGELTEPYIDTGLNIKITNQSSNKEWNDYIPLRFFKGTIPITIAAKNPENNNTAALNGFVIYPDGNNKFFMVEHNGCKPVFVPTFGNNKPYKLVFSGATVTSRLDDSTEMYYTVEPISISPRTVITDGDPHKQLEYMNFGGDNHSEDNAYPATQGFESYLSEGEIDYYTICADSEDYYGPKGGAFYSVSYVNEKGDVPETFLTSDGAVLSIIQLPQLKCDGYEFLGWYKGNTKVIVGSYAVKENITLTAKWQLTSYPVVYNLNGGTNSAANPSAYTIESSEISLAEPVRTGYKFEGWFLEKDFSGRSIELIGGGSIGGITLYAKWTPVVYKISYVLDDGKNTDANPSEYTIESETSMLGEPEKDGYLFGGWFESSDFSDAKVTEIASGSYGDKTFYAKWMKKCTVKYVSEYGEVPKEIVVGVGMTLTEEQLPELTDKVYYFGGWYDNGMYVQAGNYVISGNVIFIACWTEKCLISYNTAHGITPESVHIEEGGTLISEQLPKLKEKGWIFKGWYLDSEDSNTKVNTGYTITKSLMLYAKWDEYRVSSEDFVFVEGGIIKGSNNYYGNDDIYTYDDRRLFKLNTEKGIKSIYISTHEITQKEYESYCCYTDSHPDSIYGIGDNYPVYYVSWYDAIVYCNLRSLAEGFEPCYTINNEIDPRKWNGIKNNNGKYSCSFSTNNSIWDTVVCNFDMNGYRLPTELEWEYSARGGMETYRTTGFSSFFSGATTNKYSSLINSDLDSVGWYIYNICNNGVTGSRAKNDIPGYGAHEVKTKLPNALGLYDMSGNILELCWNNYIPSYTGSPKNLRTVRGGSWESNANACSVYNWYSFEPSRRSYYVGFRIVCSAEE